VLFPGAALGRIDEGDAAHFFFREFEARVVLNVEAQAGVFFLDKNFEGDAVGVRGRGEVDDVNYFFCRGKNIRR